MRYLVKALKAILYLIFFVLITLVALRFTLDVNELKPRIEKLVSEKTGARVDIESVELSGTLGLSIPMIDLIFPHSPERQAEWDAYDEYLKAKKLAKKSGTVEPEEVTKPLPMLQLCAQQTKITVDPLSLLSLAVGGEVSGTLDSKLFDCELSSTPLTESAPKRLHVEFNTLYGQSAERRKRTRELNVNVTLNDLELRDNQLMVDQSPIKVNGTISLEGQSTLAFGRRGKFLLKKSTTKLKLDIAGLSTEAGRISVLELPALKLGQLSAEFKLDRGKLQIDKLSTKSTELDGDITGYLQLSGAFKRTGLNLHIALDMSSEFIRKNPDIKGMSQYRKKYFKANSDGGYRVGMLIKGRIGKPRVSASQNSPYSKEGRRLKRQSRGASKRGVSPKRNTAKSKGSPSARGGVNKRKPNRNFRGKNKTRAQKNKNRAQKNKRRKSRKNRNARRQKNKRKKGKGKRSRNRRVGKSIDGDQDDQNDDLDEPEGGADFIDSADDDADEDESESEGDRDDSGDGEDGEGEGEDDDDDESESEGDGEGDEGDDD
jgi:type II secretion system protein N